jgi:hypothetical protein
MQVQAETMGLLVKMVKERPWENLPPPWENQPRRGKMAAESIYQLKLWRDKLHETKLAHHECS